MRVKGLEPPLSKENKDLNLARLPVPPHPQQNLKNTGNPLQIAHSIKIVVPVNPTLTDKENNRYTFLKYVFDLLGDHGHQKKSLLPFRYDRIRD